MTSGVLKLRIGGTAGHYRVSGEIDGTSRDDDLGDLPEKPEKMRESLSALQEAILRTTASVRDRAQVNLRPTKPPPAAAPPTAAPPGAAPPGAVRGINSVDAADFKGLKEIGSRLFDCVFQPEIYELYKDAYEAAVDGELPIKLCIEAPELAYIPWETMFDKRRLFHLSCSQATPFARVATMQELDLHIYEKPPLSVLCMVSAPKDFIGTEHELRTDVEQAALDRALAPLIKSEQVKLCWTASGTRRELKNRIVKGDEGKRWDVFMFIGHGLEGNVVFEEDGGSGYEPVSADVLRALLDARNGPKLVILNSCRGATKPEDRLASTAETLVKGGRIAAVVAMQFDISDIMGTKFSPSFFNNVTLGVSIQQAMTLTRIDLMAAGLTEWISPVLYMQNKDGRVTPDGASGSTER
jgi:CHAT domain